MSSSHDVAHMFLHLSHVVPFIIIALNLNQGGVTLAARVQHASPNDLVSSTQEDGTEHAYNDFRPEENQLNTTTIEPQTLSQGGVILAAHFEHFPPDDSMRSTQENSIQHAHEGSRLEDIQSNTTTNYLPEASFQVHVGTLPQLAPLHSTTLFPWSETVMNKALALMIDNWLAAFALLLVVVLMSWQMPFETSDESDTDLDGTQGIVGTLFEASKARIFWIFSFGPCSRRLVPSPQAS
jgi:hypothetical protein